MGNHLFGYLLSRVQHPDAKRRRIYGSVTRDAAILRDCLHCVEKQIEDELANQMRWKINTLGGNVPLEGDPFGYDLRLYEKSQVVPVGWRGLRRVKSSFKQERPNSCTNLGKAALQQCERTLRESIRLTVRDQSVDRIYQSAERVVDFVSDAGGDAPHCCKALRYNHFALKFTLLSKLVQHVPEA